MPAADQPLQLFAAAAAFAAERHRAQRRKGANADPYINHPLQVADLLANVGGITDAVTLAAAVLHDTIEDTATTPEDIRERFGEAVLSVVLEVTDDKSLPKARRKELQIEHAPHLSHAARLVKLADKICNVTGIASDPPADWPLSRQIEYLAWAEKVVAGLRGLNAQLDGLFEQRLAEGRTLLNNRGG